MQSRSKKSRVAARIFWLAAGVGLGAYALSEASSLHKRALSYLGIAIILTGINWFLQPPTLTGQIGRVDALSKASAMGPEGLRLLIALGSFACLLISLYLAVSAGGGLTAAS